MTVDPDLTLAGAQHERRTVYRPAESVDGWRLRSLLGATNSSEVWQAERDGGTAALKILLSPRAQGGSRYGRFQDEVRFMRDLAPAEGVLPLIDAHLPEHPSRRQPAWLATPVAQVVTDALGPEPPVAVVVRAVAAIARTLATLAAVGHAHRDIKPSNLFELDGAWLVGDFGLVTYPEKPDRTVPNAKLGPAHFIADEMVAAPDTADALPADVFSLAKTLWVLCVPGQGFPPAGQHRVEVPALTLSGWVTAPRLAELDLLIERSTAHDPAERPTMAQFAAELDAWLASDVQTEVPDLSDLAARIRALSEPGVRAKELRDRRLEQFEVAWREMIEPLDLWLEQLRGLFPRADGVTNPTGFTDFGHEGPPERIEIQRTAGVQATNEDDNPVELIIGVGAQWVEADEARFAAWIRMEDPYAGSKTLWTRAAAADLGTARGRMLRAELIADVNDRLPETTRKVLGRLEVRTDRQRYASWTGAGTDAGPINAPWAVISPFADDAAGCYVIDSGNDRVVRFGPGGAPLEWTSAGGKGTGYGNLDFPSGGCVTHEGKIWIADHGNRRLRYFEPFGTPLEGHGLAPLDSSVISSPADVACTPDGTLFVVDRTFDHIVEFRGGGVLDVWGARGRDPGQLSSPCGIAIRHGAFIYVADSGNDRIQKFSREGELVEVWGGRGGADGCFCAPHGIALDDQERVYVADSENHRVQVFTADGEMIYRWGTPGTNPGQFRQPRGISVDGLGNVYVAEFGGHRVQRFGPEYLTAL